MCRVGLPPCYTIRISSCATAAQQIQLRTKVIADNIAGDGSKGNRKTHRSNGNKSGSGISSHKRRSSKAMYHLRRE